MILRRIWMHIRYYMTDVEVIACLLYLQQWNISNTLIPVTLTNVCKFSLIFQKYNRPQSKLRYVHRHIANGSLDTVLVDYVSPTPK